AMPGLHAGAARYHLRQIAPEVGEDKRTLRVNGVSMVLRFKHVHDAPLLFVCPRSRLRGGIPGDREYMAASGAKDAGDFPEGACRIRDVLEHVLGNNQIE